MSGRYLMTAALLAATCLTTPASAWGRRGPPLD